MNEVGVVAALSAEARALGPGVRRPDGLARLADGTLLALSGMGGAAAAAAAHRLIDAGACALMSFGLAGGLDPALAAGSVVLPDEVISPDGDRFPTSLDWRESLRAAVGAQRSATAGSLLGSPQSIDTVTAKAAAFRTTGAAAVDMESLALAGVAAQRKLPFVALRVIVDTAADELPPAVVAATRGGQVQIWRLLGGLALSPAELPGLIRLARRYRTAMRSLAAAGRARSLTQFVTDVRVA